MPVMNAAAPDVEREAPGECIVDTVGELTPAWFTGTLQACGLITADATVDAADSEVIGTGQLGHVVRTKLTYDGQSAGPASLVVKLPSEDPGSRQMGATMGVYEAEVRFYQEIAPLIRARVPRMYSAAVEPSSGRFTLLLNDLGSDAAPGDMIAGSTPEQAALAIGELVPLQAPVWNKPDLLRRSWLDVARTEMLFAAVGQCLGPFRARFAHRIEREHMALVEKLAPKAASVPRKLWKPPFVVAHGDYRLDNMMFATTAEATPIVVLDWQGARLAPPLLDAAIFLSACLGLDERREHERTLLGDYHNALTAAGVHDFSLEDCWHSYRVSSLYPFLLAVAVSVTITETERGDMMWARLITGAADLVSQTGAAKLVD
jgi:aminoglycoside/choline kinase family phosphotransferase